MNLRPVFAVLTVSVLLLSAGCSIVPKNDPATLYRLPSTNVSGINMPSNAATETLGIATPEAGYLLSGNRIVVYPEKNIVNVYEGARWYEDTPALVQSRLIEGLQQSQLFGNVGTDQLPSQLQLLSSLRSFQSEYENGRPNAVIQLDVQLVNTHDRMPIAYRTFTTTSQATDVDISSVVDAFGRASDTLVEQLITWLQANRSSF